MLKNPVLLTYGKYCLNNLDLETIERISETKDFYISIKKHSSSQIIFSGYYPKKLSDLTAMFLFYG